MLQGSLNGYHFSCMSLHYVDMGWPIARAGLPSAIGFGVRLIIQQIQLRLGFWVAVPLQLLHLGCAARQKDVETFALRLVRPSSA